MKAKLTQATRCLLLITDAVLVICGFVLIHLYLRETLGICGDIVNVLMACVFFRLLVRLDHDHHLEYRSKRR